MILVTMAIQTQFIGGIGMSSIALYYLNNKKILVVTLVKTLKIKHILKVEMDLLKKQVIKMRI